MVSKVDIDLSKDCLNSVCKRLNIGKLFKAF